MQLSTTFNNQSFTLRDKTGTVLIEGFVDVNILDAIISPEGLLAEAKAFLDRFSLSSQVKEDELRAKFGTDLSNFIFISTVIDYGNIGTSENLRTILAQLYSRYPFLFRPKDPFWQRLAKQPQANKILATFLMPLSGLFRTDFLGVLVPGWMAIIQFIDKKCAGDAGNLFLHITACTMINKDDPKALEIIQNMLTEGSINQFKAQIGVRFALGPKIGQLLLSVMTNNSRGFNLLKGVTDEQTSKLKAPVDSAVIRVMLNTGIVKIISVNPTTNGKFARTALTTVCQNAMDQLATKLGILAIELDEIVWAIGTIPCKYRGASCFICPFTDVCDSWKFGFIKESAGAEYTDRCFSFARPQTDKNALYLRGCSNCPHKNKLQCALTGKVDGTYHPMSGQDYAVQVYSNSSKKLTSQEIDSIIQ